MTLCRFMQTPIAYLGHLIDTFGIHPTEERFLAIRDTTRQTDRKQLRSFLGAIHYYAKFISQLQSTCAPLRRLTKLDARWEWNKEHDAVFKTLKHRLTSSNILIHYDEDKPRLMVTDASDVGIWAVLMNRLLVSQNDQSRLPHVYCQIVKACTPRWIKRALPSYMQCTTSSNSTSRDVVLF